MNENGVGSGFGIVLCLALGSATAADTLKLEDCVPKYENAEGTLKNVTITVSHTKPKSFPDGHFASVDSPQGTATLTTYRFDPMKHGVGPVIVAAHSRSGEPTFLSFEPVKEFDAKWLNERLIYVEAWWGRIVASEMVFDTLEGRFLYRKLANYGLRISGECGELESGSHRNGAQPGAPADGSRPAGEPRR